MSGPSSDSLQMKKSGLQWVIKKEDFVGNKDNFLRSMMFSFGFEKQTYWQLCLSSNDDIWVGLYLYCSPGRSAGVGHIHTRVKLGLIAKNGKEANVLFQNHVFTDKGWVNVSKFIKLDFLLAKENNFDNDKLTIFCDLEIRKKIEVPESSLVREQSQTLQSGEFSDFTVVVGGEELKVHRCMLSRSPVFRAMFENEMKEKQSCRVEIEELDVFGVKGLVEFLCTGRVKELEKIAKKILPAADRYGVEKLKTLSEHYRKICYDLHPANVAELLEMAELYTLTRLKEQAITFICENSNEVVKVTSFQRLNGSDIFMEVMCALSDKAQSG